MSIVQDMIDAGTNAEIESQREAKVAIESEAQHRDRAMYVESLYRAWNWSMNMPTHGTPYVYAALGLLPNSRSKRKTVPDLKFPHFKRSAVALAAAGAIA